jgi:hypothetical protein
MYMCDHYPRVTATSRSRSAGAYILGRIHALTLILALLRASLTVDDLA